MRNDKLIPGTILVIIGTLFLLDNFKVIDFSWISFFNLWPILLVIAGVNLVFAYNTSAAATAAKIGVLVIGMGFLIYDGLGHHRRGKIPFAANWNFKDDDDDDSDDNTSSRGAIVKVEGNGHYTESYKPNLKFACLNITGGGTNYILKDETNQLFEASTKEYKNKYELKTTSNSTTATLDFDMTTGHHRGVRFNFGDTKSNTAYLKLNTTPEWEINVQTGATKLDFDLTRYKIKKLKLEGGAASFDVKMGQPVAVTNVEIATGVSGVVLNVPQNAACNIVTQTGLSSKSIKGFQNKGENEYETPGFDKATNKMYIKLSGGMSDFTVNQY